MFKVWSFAVTAVCSLALALPLAAHADSEKGVAKGNGDWVGNVKPEPPAGAPSETKGTDDPWRPRGYSKGLLVHAASPHSSAKAGAGSAHASTIKEHAIPDIGRPKEGAALDAPSEPKGIYQWEPPGWPKGCDGPQQVLGWVMKASLTRGLDFAGTLTVKSQSSRGLYLLGEGGYQKGEAVRAETEAGGPFCAFTDEEDHPLLQTLPAETELVFEYEFSAPHSWGFHYISVSRADGSPFGYLSCRAEKGVDMLDLVRRSLAGRFRETALRDQYARPAVGQVR